jgi:hypothetical protein
MNVALWLTLPTASGYVYVTRHWPIARAEGMTRRFAGGIFRALGIQVGIVGIGALVLIALAPDRFSWHVGALLFVIATCQSFHQALDPIQGAERRRVVAGVLGLLASPIRPFIIAAGFALALDKTALTLLSFHAVATILLAGSASLALVVVLRQKPDVPPHTSVNRAHLSVRSFFRYAGPYFIGVFVAQICTTAERWGLAQRCDTAATALFVQAVALGTAVASSCSSLIMAYYVPIVTQAGAASAQPLQAAWAILKRYVLVSASVMAALILLGIPLAPMATRLFFGSRFMAVEQLLPWTIFGAAMFALGQVLSVFPHCAREVVSPNLNYILSRSLYGALLLFAGSGYLPRAFAMFFAASNTVYALLMAGAAVWLTLRQRRAARIAQVAALKYSVS